MSGQIPYGSELYADQGPRLVGSMITLIALPTLFVIARLTSRKVSNAGFWWDDVWVALACALCYIQCICVLVSARHNDFGKHIYALPDPTENTAVFLRILYVYEVGYYSSVSAVKIAILAFYRRIFPVQQLKSPLCIGFAVVTVFYVGSLLATIFQCQPIHYYWDHVDPSAKGRCTNGNNILIVPGAINCVLDFLVIALPIPLLWRLRTTVKQKGFLTGIFTCAGFVCIISIIRLVVLSRLEDADVLWNYVDSSIWSVVEPTMGVVSACIPSLRPLVFMVIRGTTRGLGVTGLGSARDILTTSSGSSRTAWKGRADVNSNGLFTRLDDPRDTSKTQLGHDVEVQGGHGGGGRGREDEISLEIMDPPAEGIRVKDEVVVTSSDWIDYKDEVY